MDLVIFYVIIYDEVQLLEESIQELISCSKFHHRLNFRIDFKNQATNLFLLRTRLKMYKFGLMKLCDRMTIFINDLLSRIFYLIVYFLNPYLSVTFFFLFFFSSDFDNAW